MPNYKMNYSAQRQLVNDANILIHRYVECFEQDFPVDFDTAQSSVLEPHLLDLFKQLQQAGATTISKNSYVQLRLTPSQFPGLQRGVVVQINTPRESMFTMGSGNTVYLGASWATVLAVPKPNMAALDDATRAALAKWCNGVVRACRLRDMATKTLEQVINCLTCTGDVLMNWPMLAIIATDPTWQKRFQAGPVKLNRYKRDLATYCHLKSPKQLLAVDTLLNAALMMDTKPQHAPEVMGRVITYEKLPTDPTF